MHRFFPYTSANKLYSWHDPLMQGIKIELALHAIHGIFTETHNHKIGRDLQDHRVQPSLNTSTKPQQYYHCSCALTSTCSFFIRGYKLRELKTKSTLMAMEILLLLHA